MIKVSVILFEATLIAGFCLRTYLGYRSAKRLLAKSETPGQKGDNMPEQRDIKNLKELLSFGIAAKKAYTDILGGGLHTEKLGELFVVYQTAMPAIADIDQVPAEVTDLSREEIAELSAMVVAGGILSENAAETVLNVLQVGVAALNLYKHLKK